jgi:23S rRNA (adenine2503-C2)-methyltransferase
VLAEAGGPVQGYRIDQVWQGWYERLKDTGDLSNLPRALKDHLDESLPPALAERRQQRSGDGETIKWLWSLHDGATIETVLMHYRDRSTVCVSTQAGCAMACSFCSTGQAGFDRQLSTGEIIEQFIRAQRASPDRRLSNVVFMGMGEPMANLDRTWLAVERLHGTLGLSARHLTISTVGLLPGIRALSAKPIPVNLAVSLHAATDDLRDELVPINRRYPLADLIAECEHYFGATGRRVTLEWALIAGVNDTMAQADRLAAIARQLRAHINLIPLNPTPGYPVTGSSPRAVSQFRQRLTELGANATVRANRGTDIDAACGQLRAASAAAEADAAPAIPRDKTQRASDSSVAVQPPKRLGRNS